MLNLDQCQVLTSFFSFFLYSLKLIRCMSNLPPTGELWGDGREMEELGLTPYTPQDQWEHSLRCM